MSSVRDLREFISERLTAAAEEIFTEFEKTIVQYEEKIDRLLDISRKPPTNTANLQLQHDCKEEDVPTGSSLDQEEPEPPQNKDDQEEPEQMEEDREEVHISEEGENETDMVARCTSRHAKMFTDFQNTSIQYEEKTDPQQRLWNIKIIPQISLHRIDISHHHICKEEEEDFTHQQERSCRMDQDEPEPPQIKEEQEQLFIDQEGDRLVLKQETQTFTATPSNEDSDLSEPEANDENDKSDICGKASIKKSPLTRSEHTSGRSCSCDVCGRCFTRAKRLTVHMRTHTGEKPYSCQTCEKGFSNMCDLTAHERVHADEEGGRMTEEEEGEGRLSPDGIVPTSRFVNISAGELDKLEKTKNETNTFRQTIWAFNCFQTWLQAKSISLDIQSVEKRELNQILREFYGSVRTTKGELYGISSYLGLRAGLNRYINEPPISRSWNLIMDSEFIQSNNVFKGVIKQIRRAGKDRKTHHPAITLEDQLILKHSAALRPDNPKGLLNKVWYDLQLHFGRRGREGNRALKPDSFLLKTNENGVRYFTLSLSEENTIYKDLLEREREKGRGVMFEEPGNYLCPVASLLKYFSKIPADGKALYLQPKRSVAPTDIWYTAAPLGINALAQMLPNMCREAGTKTIYTNHSLKATAIQRISDPGLAARQTTAASEDRSESSLQSYWQLSMDSRKRWSSTLSDQTESAIVAAKQQSAKPDTNFTACTIGTNVQVDGNTK